MLSAQLLTIDLNGDKVLKLKLERSVSTMPARMLRTADALAVELETHIKRDYLSGQALRVVTGKLRRSIHHTAGLDGPSIVYGKVYSAGVPYAAIQNYGGRTPPHDIFPRNASVLAFKMGGRTVFAKVVHHPGSLIPASPYMEPALADMQARISNRFAETASDI